MGPTSFSLFPTLPAELRNQIWEASLPQKVSQALYFYKPGCWAPRRLTEADAEYDPENDALNLNFEFFHDSLDRVRVDVPLFSVNREARSIALPWIREQGLQPHYSRDHEHCLVFVRAVNPAHDTLYVPLDQWHKVLSEAIDRLFEPDLLGRNISCPGPVLKRIAIPEKLLMTEIETLPEIFEWYTTLETLFVVVDTPPDLRPDYDVPVQRRWELEDTRAAAFAWNRETSSFEWEGQGGYIVDQPLCEQIEGAGNMLGRSLRQDQKHRFEIRPVFAVMK